jgi:RNA polymerase sigma-70 factor (ECF subfamily)
MPVYPDHTDRELLKLLKTGDREAYTVLYNRHWKFLFTAAYNALRHKSDSMDVCQAVFLWLWENRLGINVEINLKGYLYTAVKYKIANLIRQGKVREILLDNLMITDIRTEEINELETKELEHFIARLIEDLPEKCKEVFLLSRNEHLSHKQISERLGISEKTVDDHITRALKKMRAPLDRMAILFLLL